MPEYDPSTALRRLESGFKNDGWIVSLPPDGDDTILELDTGLDSVAIARIPDRKWDRGPAPRAVHAHDGYDETILVSSGSGTLYHGPDAEHIAVSRFERPVVIVVPAGAWHHVVMDPGVTAEGTSFFTVPGRTIERFSIQMAIVAKGRVPFADLPIVHPKAIEASTWTAAAVASGSSRARLVEVLPADAAPAVRVLPFEAPSDGELPLPLDTGQDSLFIMASPPSASDSPPGPAAVLEPPEFVDVHRHPDVDEYIIRSGGSGYLLNGPLPETVSITPFRGPCVIVMPAGAFHRIVQVEEDGGGPSILVYADRRAVVERYEVIMARTLAATFSDAPVVGTPA
jgi:oxalate decarboxylase/phosphoglucose isomerase-like protein (cupin superfamily)